MKALSLLLVVLFCASRHSVAQDAGAPSGSTPGVPEQRRFDLSLFSSVGGHTSQNGSHTPSTGLMLRRSSRRDPQKHHRIGLGYASDTRGLRTHVIPVSSDTALLARSFVNERMVYGLAAVEIERNFRKQTFVAAGLEARGGYGWGSRDSLVQVMSRGTAANEGEASYFGKARNVWSAFGTAIVFVGFRGYDRHYAVGLDAFTGVRAAYLGEAGDESLDLSLGNIGLRLFVGYRF